MSAFELEQHLRNDLASAAETFGDDRSAGELYRSLANVAWSHPDAPGGHVTLSWRSAEELVNDVRAKAGKPPLELAQSGGEGEIATQVSDLLGAAGWRSRPATTDERDPDHVAHGETEPRTEPNTLPNVAHTPADPSAPGVGGDAPGHGV